MGRRFTCGFIVLALGTGGMWSQDFLDDQVLLQKPGLSIQIFRVLGPDAQTVCNRETSSFACQGFLSAGNSVGTDAVAALYETRDEFVSSSTEPTICGTGGDVTDILRRSSAGDEVVARVPSCARIAGCPDGIGEAEQRTFVLGFTVDNVNGLLYIALSSQIAPGPFGCSAVGIVRISGLPTLLDIIPTFQPAREPLSWVVPKHPEALPAADRFMVYEGDVAELRDDRDFSRAVPVDCAVPDAGVPNPGDFLSILDPLFTPPSGQAAYVLVGVENAGARRFGRQNIGGTLSGRDPMAFRACS